MPLPPDWPEFLSTVVDWPGLYSWFTGRGLRIALVALLAWIGLSASRRLLPAMLRAALSQGRAESEPGEIQKRFDTLNSVARTTLAAAVWVIALFTILAELEINIAPLLAGVSVAGIALGFGAQTLVRDAFGGLFILLEDQYRKGDIVKIAGISGLVEDVNLRRTVLRDLDGTLHTVPNGEVKITSNLTRDWSRVNLDLRVAYETNLSLAAEVVNRVGEDLAADSRFGPLILEPPKVLRLESLDDTGVVLKVLGVTRPMKQWEVAGELRWRLKQALEAEGISMRTSPPAKI
jgi:moderate conductance mechanosensitive channel